MPTTEPPKIEPTEQQMNALEKWMQWNLGDRTYAYTAVYILNHPDETLATLREDGMQGV